MSESFLQGIDVSTALALMALLGIVPTYIGLSQAMSARNSRANVKGLLSGVALGLAIFFTVDLFEEASSLGVDFGLRSNPIQLVLLLSFSTGLLLLPALESIWGSERESAGLFHPFVAYLFALGIGFHSFGEGVVAGYDLSAEYTSTLPQTVLQALSFSFHKLSEGFIISMPFLFGGSKRAMVSSGLVAGIPLLLGTLLGFSGISGIVTSYSFAAGAGATTYILVRLAHSSYGLRGSWSLYLGVLAGLLFMYFAGWMHSIEL